MFSNGPKQFDLDIMAQLIKIRSCKAEAKGFGQARKIPFTAISICIQLSLDHRKKILFVMTSFHNHVTNG